MLCKIIDFIDQRSASLPTLEQTMIVEVGPKPEIHIEICKCKRQMNATSIYVFCLVGNGCSLLFGIML